MASDGSTWPPLACSVRGCALPLARLGRCWVCARGHSFDLARSGYCNLLQPNDRRSLDAGDSAEQVAARVRLHARGVAREIDAALVELARPFAGRGLLEVGCGPGFALEHAARALACPALGLDLSVHAIDAAAKRAPALAWVVANADRRLPVLDGSVGLVLSVTGPKNWSEFRRVLVPSGRALVALPASDDQAELRAAVLGEARELERVESALRACAAELELVERRSVRSRVALDRAGLADLLLATYRGARPREAERAAGLAKLEVTLALELCLLAPRG